MTTPKHRYYFILAALAASTLALPAIAQPQVAPVDVSGRAPTTIRLDVTGLDFATVRPRIEAAATTVCNNAVNNHDISFVDESWCSQTASYKAKREFMAIARARTTYAQAGEIVLSAR